MSEYFTFDVEPTDDPDVMELVTSEMLTEEEDGEVYLSPEDGEVGSTIAQTLFHGVDGIMTLTIQEDTLIIRRDSLVPWETIIDDIRDVLRDFFL